MEKSCFVMSCFLLSIPPHSCVECQSRYFDCEFDQNENDKTDGGLGAGNGDFNYGNECFAWIQNENIVALICGSFIENDDPPFV